MIRGTGPSTATALVRVAVGSGRGLVAAWADALRWPGGRGAGLGGGPGGGTPPDCRRVRPGRAAGPGAGLPARPARSAGAQERLRSEEHTSELQSRQYLVCRLLLE